MHCNDEAPLVSVVVPIYNVSDYLKQCVESILRQTYQRLEVILVNDGSTDDSGKICENYRSIDERVIVLRKENGGLVSARKAGLKQASGIYTLYVDGGDWILDDYIEKLVDHAEENDVDIVVAGFTSFYKENRTHSYCNGIKSGYYDRASLETEVLPYLIPTESVRGIASAVWCKLFLTSLLKEHQFNVSDDISIGEDMVCTFPCILSAKSIYIDNDIQDYQYRTNMQSMTRVPGAGFMNRAVALMDGINNVFTPFMTEDLRGQLDCYIEKFLLHTVPTAFINFKKPITSFRNVRRCYLEMMSRAELSREVERLYGENKMDSIRTELCQRLIKGQYASAAMRTLMYEFRNR